MSALHRIASSGCLIVLIAGCSTPASVRDLASHGVAVTTRAESELANFTARTQRLYDQRLEALRRLAASDIENSSKTEFENYTAQRAGMTDQAESVRLITELSQYRATLRENALRERAAMEEKLKPVDEKATVPKEKLAAVRRAFGELSQELSDKEWIKFAVSYGKQVNESLKKSKEEAAKAEEKANASADQSKSKAKAETQNQAGKQ